jgi:hypothetical protein
MVRRPTESDLEVNDLIGFTSEHRLCVARFDRNSAVRPEYTGPGGESD